MNVEDTLRELVAINSVSARSNAEIISYLEARCTNAGFGTRRFLHIDEVGVEKINLVAWISVCEALQANPVPLSNWRSLGIQTQFLTIRAGVMLLI